MRNDEYRDFWLDGAFGRAGKRQIWTQTRPRCNGRWYASGFSRTGSSLQWYLVPRAACHICERKRPVSWYLAEKDYYGRSGANLHLYRDVAREALGPAIIRAIRPPGSGLARGNFALTASFSSASPGPQEFSPRPLRACEASWSGNLLRPEFMIFSFRLHQELAAKQKPPDLSRSRPHATNNLVSYVQLRNRKQMVLDQPDC